MTMFGRRARIVSVTRSRLFRTALSAVGAATILHTSEVASASPSLLWRAALDGSPGRIETRYAMPDVNRCLEDMSGYYGSDRIPGETGLGVVHSYKSYEVEGHGCMTLNVAQPNEHVEGVARIPVAGREMLYFSYMNAGPVTAYSSLVRVDVRANEALTPDQFLLSQTTGRDADLMFCKTVTNGIHIGGMQAVGDYLFAGIEEDGANDRVDIYQVKDGNVMRDQSAITVNTVRLSGEKAHHVMATVLSDGKYLMAVNRGNTGTFSLYWADAPMGQWEHLGDPNFPALKKSPEVLGWNADGLRYQSANFVTDCAGKLYIVGLGQNLEGTDWSAPNEVFMYAVDLRRDVDLRPAIVGLNQVGFFKKDSLSDKCQMRGAGGAHVTPSGRLSLYCGPQKEFESGGHDFYFSSLRPPE